PQPQGNFNSAFGTPRISQQGFENRKVNGGVAETLAVLKNFDPGIVCVFITNAEGHVIESASSLDGRVWMGASSAISLAVARKASRDLRLGNANELIVKCERGFILIFDLGARGVLSVVANEFANISNILQQGEKAVSHLAMIA